MAELYDVTIIGGGPVGLFAAFYAGLRHMRTKIIDSLPELGGQLTALYPEKFVYDMPGFPEIYAKALAHDMVSQAMRFDPTVVLEERAEQLTRTGDHWTLTTHTGAEHQTKCVIICAGAGAFRPKKHQAPGVEEFEGRGVYYGVRSKADFEGRRVIVVGGGDSAVDWALNLEPIASNVTLLHRRDVFRAHEDSVRQIHEGRVELMTFWEIKEVHGERFLEACTVFNNQTKDEQRIEVDAIVFNLGFSANLGPIKEWGLELEGNQIIVNSHMETNLPGVFAAGDVNTYDGKLKLIATGVGEATIAVCYAKHEIEPDSKVFPGHSSDMDLSASPLHETS